jgi:hypothetical protein
MKAYLDIVQGFALFAAKCKPAEVPGRDLLLKVTAQLKDGSENHGFYFMPYVMGRSGRQVAEQSFVRLVAREDPPLAGIAGLKLDISFVDLVKPLKKSQAPLDQQECGAMKVLTEQQLAKHIVTMSSSTRGLEEVSNLSKVVVSTLLYRDIDLYRVEVEGEDEPLAFHICVDERPHPVAKRPKQHGRLDLCSDVLDEERACRSAAASRGKARESDGRPGSSTDGPQHFVSEADPTVREALRALGLDAADVTEADFCTSDGLLSAVFSAMPAEMQADLVDLVVADDDETGADSGDDLDTAEDTGDGDVPEDLAPPFEEDVGDTSKLSFVLCCVRLASSILIGLLFSCHDD